MANEIVITFEYELYPAVEDLGNIFAALARDYRDASNGSTLVVTRIETGSIILAVTDAALAAVPYVKAVVGGMAAISTIDKFAENLKKWFGTAKTPEGRKQLHKKGKKPSGRRSVEAIIATAAKTRSHVILKHTKANGEILEVQIAPGEATQIQEAALPKPVDMKQLAFERSSALAIRKQVETAVDKFRKAGRENLSQSQIEALVEIIVSTLSSAGAAHVLPELASQLEIHGLNSFADEVRRHIRGRGGALEAPITTT